MAQIRRMLQVELRRDLDSRFSALAGESSGSKHRRTVRAGCAHPLGQNFLRILIVMPRPGHDRATALLGHADGERNYVALTVVPADHTLLMAAGFAFRRLGHSSNEAPGYHSARGVNRLYRESVAVRGSPLARPERRGRARYGGRRQYGCKHYHHCEGFHSRLPCAHHRTIGRRYHSTPDCHWRGLVSPWPKPARRDGALKLGRTTRVRVYKTLDGIAHRLVGKGLAQSANDELCSGRPG